ncbi:sensor histidine kinase [Marinomonas gallaica]|uniref:sensor histidine kinase n=1 Tax=Marinomonas gallaica TaxID=1806667 RepID=UPI003CE58F99
MNKFTKPWMQYIVSAGVPAGIILLALPLRQYVTVSDVMLLGVACVTFIGFRFGKSEAIVASVTSVLFVDVLFVDPYYTLAVHNFDYFVSFGVMLAVGVFIAQLAQRNQIVELEKQATMRLKEREEIRANLLRSIGHDLRTPLGTVMGASSLLMEDSIVLSKSQQQEQISNIYQQSLILKNQIDKMLELSRIRDLQTTSDWLTLPCVDLVSSAFVRIKASQIDGFSVDYGVDSVKGDSALLEIALANLIDNASRHGSAPCKIQFSRIQTAYCLEVINGLGEQNTPQTDSGNGLGFLICDAIAKLHGGEFLFQKQSNQVSARICWEEQ